MHEAIQKKSSASDPVLTAYFMPEASQLSEATQKDTLSTSPPDS